MIVVIDSNTWLSTLALRSSLGAAVLFYVSQQGSTLAVPEVVRLEVEVHLRTLLQESIDALQTHHRKLLAIFGKLKEMVVPQPEEIDAVVARAFAMEPVKVRDLPFSLESARNSFLRTVNKIPPSHRTQQFKDGVIWADCVALLDEDDVVLVTNDKAFFEGDDYKQGLARALQAEIIGKPRTLRILHQLSDLLEQVRVPIELDAANLMSALGERYGKSFGDILDVNGFAAGAVRSCETKLFATSDPTALHIEFTLELDAVDAADRERPNGVFRISGSGRYIPKESRFMDLRRGGEELTYQSPMGEQVTRSNVIGAGSIVLGHADVLHSVRHPI